MINEKLLEILLKNNLKISFAESCTGGLCAKMLTDVSGSSAVTDENYITYSESAKQKILGVNEETIKRFSVVSAPVAIEMAKGLFKEANCDIAVSITGVAGPGSDKYSNPVGLVYVAICTKDFLSVKKLKFRGERKQIRKKAANSVFAMTCSYIKKNY